MGGGKRKGLQSRTGRVRVVFFFGARELLSFGICCPFVLFERKERERKDEQRGGAALDGDAGDRR